ncbi:hypothetical protein G6F40_013325 [Rhizopus arrhizus]|nr:hypothetical protein G6F40_013325 [Rhizopus arrhizus]KAG1251637.1 hypothetical protein G6F65_018264 [Rhizopus arrhizus]
MSTRFDPPERGPLGPDVATVVTAPIVPPASESAVSWGAIFAGAVAAAALSLILLILGVGLGLSSVSPWSFEGVSKETFGWSSIAWLTFTALAASGLAMKPTSATPRMASCRGRWPRCSPPAC